MRSDRHRRRLSATPMINVTSMMDMFTIILVFLLNFLDPASDVAAGMELPLSSATDVAPEGTTMTVTKEAVKVNGQDVLALVTQAGQPALPPGLDRTGRRIETLYDRLAVEVGAFPGVVVTGPGAGQPAEKSGSDAVLRVECDRGVPFSVLGDVLYTAGQAGFEQFRFVVISEAG